MGFYLSHLRNSKGDPANGVFPDENFAREILQLFSIGVYRLNQNGNFILNRGEFIENYNNDDGELVDEWETPYFFHANSRTDMDVRSAGPDQVMYTEDDLVATSE